MALIAAVNGITEFGTESNSLHGVQPHSEKRNDQTNATYCYMVNIVVIVQIKAKILECTQVYRINLERSVSTLR